MAMRRHINWSGAMHDLHVQRPSSPFINASGCFDLSAIMRAAIADARHIGHGLRLSWAERLSVTLRCIWSKAKRAAVTARPVAA